MDERSPSPAKRSYAHHDRDRDDKDNRDDLDDRDGRGRHKRRRVSEPPLDAEIEYRILCPVSRIGGVIGRGGTIIKSLREQSRAKIKVEDAIQGAEERLVYITSSARKGRGDENSFRSGYGDLDILCPAQDALFRVFSCITGPDDREYESREEHDEPPVHVTARLLVSDRQVGCLIGKGGRIIEQMRKDIAAQIRVLPKSSLPPCAFPSDELVQLSGIPAVVKEALYSVSTKLFENPLREKEKMHHSSGISQGASYLSGGMNSVPPDSMYGMGHYGRPNSFPVRSSRSDGPMEEELMVCVLCPNDKIGSVIGRGGAIIRRLRQESGAKIRVCDQVGDSEERVIQVSAMEYVNNYASPTLEAVIQIFNCLAEVTADRDGKHSILSIRLLISASRIGCLLGKGGEIISEMRKTSRANIRIPPREELPSCADNESELVQVSGEAPMVEAALLQVVTRLRSNLFFKHRGGYGSRNLPIPCSRGCSDEPRSPNGYSYGYRSYNLSPRSTRDSRYRLR
ncbi:hypothetical protein KP509_01G083700 [Ceratopteris richardii]|uniref:K Homology domain-containing protein n=1 Tax=Ceratopteris richardii TaxID=49495 RepID=A0A8T2VRA7_CERRI|nr:hypothetical protein KP509_01G083700 [Ceratopteris richardii]